MPNPVEFSGRGRPLTQKAVDSAVAELDVPAATFWAVMAVESRGFGFLADRRPKILFERHVFHERTGGRFSAAHPDISNKKSGGYGGAGAPQFERLSKAIALDRKAALESASWGLGQVMGYNARTAGFSAVEEMIAAMVDEEDQQMAGMVSFISENDLAKLLKQQRWEDFARRYNGPSYKKNRYDEKLEIAFNLYTVGATPDLMVRGAQACLFFIGYDPRGIDGVFGSGTQKALMRYQKDRGLKVDGLLSKELVEALWEEAFP